jgi:hypothetical protein
MMENRHSPEQPIQSQQIHEQYTTFAHAVSEGFQTPEAELSATGRFLTPFAKFLDSESVRKDRNPEAIALIERVVLNPDLGLLPDTALQELKQECRLIPGTKRHPDLTKKVLDTELHIISREITKQLQEITKQHHTEVQQRTELQTLASVGEQKSVQPETEHTLKERDQVEAYIRQTAIDYLSRDPQLGSDIRQWGVLSKELQHALESETLDKQTIRRLLEEHRDFTTGTSGKTWLEDMDILVDINDQDEARAVAQKNLTELTDSNFIWNRWVEKGYISDDFLRNVTDLKILSDFATTTQAVAHEPPEVRAVLLAPFLQQGLSATLIMDAVKGNTQLTGEYIRTQTESLLQLFTQQNHELKRTPMPRHKKLAAVALMSMAILWSSNSPQVSDDILPPPPVTQQELGDTIQPELTPSEHIETQVTVSEPEPPSPQQTPSTTQSEYTPQQQELPPKEELPIYRPENSGKEAQENGSKIVVWELQGENLSNYYRYATAARFDMQRLGWVKEPKSTVSTSLVSAETVTQTITSPFMQTQEQMGLVVPYGFELVNNAVTLSGDEVHPSLVRQSDGTYILVFQPEDMGKIVSITINVGETEELTIPRPSATELGSMSEKMIELDALPEDIRDKISEINRNSEATIAERAKTLEQYMIQRHVYSLDKEHNGYYFEEGIDASEMVTRMLERGLMDCDTANAAFIAVLRAQGIPARSATVYSNAEAEGVTTGDLRASEAHGITEIWDSEQQRWFILDATPYPPPEEQQDIINRQRTANPLTEDSAGQQYAPDEAAIPEKESNILKLLTSLKSAALFENTDNLFSLGMLKALALYNVAAYGAARYLSRRHRREAPKLKAILKQRMTEYFGTEELAKQQGITREEMIKLSYIGEKPASLWAALVPGRGYLQLAKALSRRHDLLTTPYRHQNLPEVPTPEEPNTVELLSEVLGYDTSQMVWRMQKEAFRDYGRPAIDRARRQGEQHIKSLFIIIDDKTQNAVEKIQKSLYKATDPKDHPETTSENPEELGINTAYQLYAADYHRQNRFYDETRSNFPKPQLLDEEAFSQVAKRVIRSSLIERQIRESFKSAKETYKKNRRLLNRMYQ